LRLARLVACLVAGAFGCARHVVTPTGPTDPTQVLRECGDPPADLARLASYWDVKIPASYWIDMTFDGTEWTPAAPIPAPPHHASRLELADLPGAVASGNQMDQRVRFTIEITSRDIQPVAGRGQWRVTYRARVISACWPCPFQPRLRQPPSRV